jgi:hypothetical protein
VTDNKGAAMTTAAEEFRLHGEECLQQARLAARPEIQAALLSMADHWNELAICMDAFAQSVVPAATVDMPARHNRNARFVGRSIPQAIA